MKRPVQYFTKEYLEACKALTADQIIEFLEGFRELMASSLNPDMGSKKTVKKKKHRQNKLS
jgi:hypothetical protein